MSNTIGLVPGGLSGSIGYRRELEGQGARLARLLVASVAGGATGGVLLLVLPSGVFRGVVPVLILLACVLVVVQPRVSRWVQSRRRRSPGEHHGGPWLYAAVYATGVYGGYFGAAQGVLLIALLAIFLDDHLQRLNAAKNVLALVVNGVAAVVFIAVADIAWWASACLALGSVLGGQLGAKVGRRLSPPLLRGVIVVVGVGVAARLLV